jgi:hypothetical protein
VYLSKLHGKNRRQEHIALHNKAFRYDDPFWNTYYPPNGWGCQCRVTTKSEHGAERDGVKVLQSDADGNPPAISGADWDAFDPTWQYNPALEALAPNFSKYTNLPKESIKQIYGAYHQSMNGTRLTEGEFTTLVKSIREPSYKTLNIMYQVGNVETKRFQAMQKEGVTDSKVMGTDFDLWHGLADKVSDQIIDEQFFGECVPDTSRTRIYLF